MKSHPSNTWLFVWNPAKWPWPELPEDILHLNNGEKLIDSWNCVSHKRVKPGDRAFISRVGSEPRGIFASGYVASEPFFAPGRKGKPIPHVKIDFEVVRNPDKDPILTIELLQIGPLARQLWTPQSSGISIKPELVDELETVWKDFLAQEEGM